MPGQKTHPLERVSVRPCGSASCVERRVVTVGISELNQPQSMGDRVRTCGHVVKLRHRAAARGDHGL